MTRSHSYIELPSANFNFNDLHFICLYFNRGLRPLLSRWAGKGFGRDLKKLLALLDAGSEQQAELHVRKSKVSDSKRIEPLVPLFHNIAYCMYSNKLPGTGHISKKRGGERY